ncbi:hypothetical protein [Microbacterium sp. NPDC087589]|uniref:hypothetical protein n=1 Tax=Microbacterium sp. NPDC087589 TaxID=3364191 RepID=UPI0037FFCFC1
MIGVAVAGIALLIVGGIVGRAGRKLGTAIACALVLAWFGVLGWFALSGNLDGPAVQMLALYLGVGLVAFLIGSNLTSRISPTTESRESS